MKRILFLACCSLALQACDDKEEPATNVVNDPNATLQAVYAQPANGAGIPQGDVAAGAPISTMSSEFGYVDNPAIGGSGDPGTSGNWYTGSSGNYIGGQDSQGVSLPAANEIALYGSIQAAQGQPVEVINEDNGTSVTTQIADVGPGATSVAQGKGVDLLYSTARSLDIPVNGSAHVQVVPLTSQNFNQ